MLADALYGMRRLPITAAGVTRDHDMRGGIPVLIGTRIGVYETADYAASEPMQNVLGDFPGLTDERTENAGLYAKAHPLNGRRSKAARCGETGASCIDHEGGSVIAFKSLVSQWICTTYS